MDRALAALVASCLIAPALAAPPVLPHYARERSLGVASCASSLCHGSIETWKDARVQQNEYVIWSRSDRHARAYRTLLSERSVDIARRLGLKEPAHQAAVCLDCHAHNVAPERRVAGFMLSDGVTCESCHGPGERWLKSHVEPGAKSQANIARGMYPTEDNLARAKLCLSCHLGNPQKLVTHRIMAAGHPRLSFEIDTFTNILPAHYDRGHDAAPGASQWHGVRAWAIGQAVAAEELLNLLADPKRGRDGLFPELVLFDCHACHHPMSDKRYAGTRLGVAPGAVRLNDSSLLMVRQIARRVDPAAAEILRRDMARLYTSLAGADDGVARARAVQRLIQDLLPKVDAHRFSADDLRGVLLGLIDDGLAGQYSDYQGAEQAVMALQSVSDFMSRRGLLKSSTVKPAMSRVMAAVANDEKYAETRFAQALRDLRSGIEEGMKQ